MSMKKYEKVRSTGRGLAEKVTLRKDLTEVREPTMWISWEGMSQAQGTASSRTLRGPCAGGAAEFQEEQKATVVGTV